MADNPTIVVGHLNDKELKESIDSLVKHVDTQSLKMAENFDAAIQLMRESLKSLSGVKIDITSSLDGLESAKKKLTSGSTSGGGASASAPNTIGELREQISLQGKIVDEQVRGTAELQREVDLHAQLKNDLREETKSTQQRAQENAKAALKNTFSLPSSDINSATAKLRALLQLQSNYTGKGIFSTEQWNRLQKEIDKTRQQIERLKSKMPKTITDVLGMDESSVDAISKKMQALKKVQIDPNNAAQVKLLGEEYTRLGKKQNEYLGKNLLVEKSNHALASTFGYIRNRIIYAFTIGALARFARDLASIRAEYEMLDRSLGILVGDFDRGTQIFNELNQMALKSPFTLVELGTAAKQLTAYNFSAEEVVDTTRRLADISAALGVPMERLTYNLGQIKAQGALTARDARDFANAGLAIVPMLAKMYTEQKAFGDEVVTTAKVYDMMSKKMVTYSDVLRVLYQVTDEGGKFFDFQARQATTLKVQMANLTLAYNNMMNEIGKDNQGILAGTIQGVRYLFENWREVWRILQTIIVTYGTYRAMAALVTVDNSRMFAGSILAGLKNYVSGIRAATGAMATLNAVTKLNPIGFLASALAAVVGYFVLFKNNVESVSAEVEMFGESASKTLGKINTLQKILAGTDEKSQTYKKTLSELSGIAKEYGIELDAEKARRDEINKATERTIELIKEESSARQRANLLQQSEERYGSQSDEARKTLEKRLMSAKELGKLRYGLYDLEDVQANASAISYIIASVVQENISLIAGKTGKEYQDGINKVFAIIQGRMRAIGISESSISEEWIYQGLTKNINIVGEYINTIAAVKNEQDSFNDKVEKNYKAEQEATQSTMTFTEKVNANARALRNASNDALSLYNRVYDIVKIAKENHVINFDLKVTAEDIPAWMMKMDLKELQNFAERFTSVATSGGHVVGYDREGTYERGLQYAAAARRKQEEEERNARNKEQKDKTKKSDQVAKALKDEISLVKQLQSAYDTLTKKGDSHANAVSKVQEMYGNTIDLLNKSMDKFGLPRLDLSIIKGNNQNEVLAFFERVRDVLESKGLSNLERMEAVEGVIKEFRLKADTFNLDMITKGLNNELGKLKEEYELAVELDANPELGDVFADMMGLSKDALSDLPRNFEAVIKRLQSIVDDKLGTGKFNVQSNLNRQALNDYLTASGIESSSEMAKQLTAIVDYSNKVRKDETKKQIDDWNKLLEKYAEYEYKVTQIQKEAERERETARKKGASQEILDAINNREKQELARLSFEEFQKTPEWIVATGELADMSKSAIGMLIEQLEKYKRSATNLSPKQIKQLNSALRKLYKEQRKNNPFKAISNMLDEAKERMATFDEDIEKTQKEIDNLKEKKKESIADGIADEETDNKLKKAIKRLKELKEAREESGKIDASSWVSSINEMIGPINQVTSSVGDMFAAFGDTGVSENIQKVTQVLEKAGSMAALGAKIGGGWGALIGGVLGGLMGAITAWADEISGNAAITKQVEKSEMAVKRLELAYIDLEHAIDKAFGTGIIGAQALALENKKLQLAELQRQLQLEESRNGKKRDEDKIIDLQSQIKELEYDIHDTMNNVMNDLLGISSVGDAIENMVGVMIDALRSGDNAIDAFNDSVDDMILNLVKKWAATNILAPRVSAVLDSIQSDIDERVQKATQEASDLEQQRNAAKDSYNQTINRIEKIKNTDGNETRINKLREEAFKWAEELTRLDEAIAMANQNLAEASTYTLDDLKNHTAQLEELKLYGEGFNKDLEELLNTLGLSGSTENKNLSALQQGIQGITEDTAGALEAYMNGVSQQVYLHSTLLTQIRDAVVALDGEIQVGVQAQMLLQLQQSYAVQMAIQGILEGALNPSGRAFSVELIS